MATTMGETVSSSALVVPLDQPPTDENLVPQVVVGDALALDQPLGGNAVPQVLVGEEVVAMVQPRAGNELPQVVVGDEPCVDRFSFNKLFSIFTRFIPSVYLRCQPFFWIMVNDTRNKSRMILTGVVLQYDPYSQSME